MDIDELLGPPVMSFQELRAIRLSLRASQGQMAIWLGMPLRTYEDIEAGRSPVRGVHAAAITYAAMKHFVATPDDENIEMPWWIFPLIDQVKQKEMRRANSARGAEERSQH